MENQKEKKKRMRDDSPKSMHQGWWM